MKKTLAVINAIALLVTILINYISNTGAFNGNTMSTISNRYENYFTPAGYAFSIWGLIYLALAGFVFYHLKEAFKTSNTTKGSKGSNGSNGSNGSKGSNDSKVLTDIGWLFLVSCVANSLWVVAWLYDFLAISVVLMIVLFGSLLGIILKTKLYELKKSSADYFFNYLPFALYGGWISVALVANVAAFLTSLNWDAWNISPIYWTIFMILVAGVVHVFMVSTRNLREFGLVAIWALIAIAMANKQLEESVLIVYSCYFVAGIILLSIGLNFFKQVKKIV